MNRKHRRLQAKLWPKHEDGKPFTDKEALLLVQQGRCFYCLKRLLLKTATVDHIVPRSRKGSLGFKNKVVACVGCNMEKSSQEIHPQALADHFRFFCGLQPEAVQ